MSDFASTAWNTGAHPRCGKPPRRALEIAGVVLAFIWFWPVALAYLVWKIMGYPKFDEAKAFMHDNFGRNVNDFFSSRCAPPGGFTSGTGNAAFDDYRRNELERLEEERRKLDEEARDFRGFVEELKRAKDREEFDAFMAKRRNEQTAQPTSDRGKAGNIGGALKGAPFCVVEPVRSAAGIRPRVSGKPGRGATVLRARFSTNRCRASHRHRVPRMSVRNHRAGTSGRSRSPFGLLGGQTTSPKTRPSNSSSWPSGQATIKAETKWARRLPFESIRRFCNSRSTRSMAAAKSFSAPPNPP